MCRGIHIMPRNLFTDDVFCFVFDFVLDSARRVEPIPHSIIVVPVEQGNPPPPPLFPHTPSILQYHQHPSPSRGPFSVYYLVPWYDGRSVVLPLTLSLFGFEIVQKNARFFRVVRPSWWLAGK